MTQTSRRRRWRNLILFTVVAIIILGSIGLFGLTYLVANGTIHPQRLAVRGTPDDHGLSDWREVNFTTSDDLTLYGWFIPPESGQGTVLFVHGHAANRTQFLSVATILHENGYGALLFDLRNSGNSDGSVTTLGYYEARDVISAYAFLQAQPEINPDSIVLYGHSMGGASTVLAMPELTGVSGLVLDSTFTSVEANTRSAIRQILPISSPFTEFALWVMHNGTGADFYAVRPIDIIPALTTPLLILHGSSDPTVPVEHGAELFALAQNPYDFVIFQGAGHGGLYAHNPDLYMTTLLDFLESVFAP